MSIKIGAAKELKDKMDDINIISATKFNDGGAAILAEQEINHIKVIMGNKDRSPFVK